MTVERRPPAAPFIPMPEDFSDAWTDTELALGRVGHGLKMIDDLLCGPLAQIPVEDQNKLGFLVDSILMHFEAAERHLGDVAKAARAIVRPQP